MRVPSWSSERSTPRSYARYAFARFVLLTIGPHIGSPVAAEYASIAAPSPSTPVSYARYTRPSAMTGMEIELATASDGNGNDHRSWSGGATSAPSALPV